jgi:hypothetical protein
VHPSLAYGQSCFTPSSCDSAAASESMKEKVELLLVMGKGSIGLDLSVTLPEINCKQYRQYEATGFVSVI